MVVIARSGRGAVRVIGDLQQSKDVNSNENVVTHPTNKEEYCLILLQSNQSCAILGAPSYRLVTRSAPRRPPSQLPPVCPQ